jgi:hypothetical protein
MGNNKRKGVEVNKKGEVHVQKPKETETSNKGLLSSTQEASYTEIEGGANIKIYHNDFFEHMHVDQHVVDPNLPRPPDPPYTTHIRQPLTNTDGKSIMEGEEYVDASDGLGGTLETNMDFVGETPNLSQ